MIVELKSKVLYKQKIAVLGMLLPSLQHGFLRSEENVVLNNIVDPKVAPGVFCMIVSEMLNRTMFCIADVIANMLFMVDASPIYDH